MKRAFILLLSCFLLSLACGIAMANEPSGTPVDFTKYQITGAGEWITETTANGIQYTQKRAQGGNAILIFDGVTLPTNFSFSAEMGCIEGNNPTQRPYFGLYFNYSEGKNLILTFRPSQKQYEISRSIDGKAELLGKFADANPWPWELKEWRTLRVVRKGNTVEAYVNNQLIISAEDTQVTGGSFGFFSYSTAAVFKNIKFSAL